VRFHQLTLFCRVFEDGTVSGAAAALLISQPAASLQIKELERELGAALFERQGRRLVPTAAGELFYAYARTLTGVWEEAEQALAALAEGRRGVVNLGASTTGVMYHLPPLLRAFRTGAPDVQIVLQCANTDRVCGWLLRRRVDAGLVWGPVQEPGLVAETILQSAFALVLPADHPLAEGRGELAPEDLAGVPFVFQERRTSTRRFVEGALRRAGLAPEEAMALASTEEVKQAVEAGLGAAVVAERAVAREVAAGVLAVRRVAGLDLRRPLDLVTRPGEPESPALARFVRFVRADGARWLA
jgi:DNA-binding transcriptional LysR family regulator